MAKKPEPLPLRALEYFALSKAAAGPVKKLRDKIVPGMAQPVDVTIRISGAVNVGDDGQATRTIKAGGEMALAAALSAASPEARAVIVERMKANPGRKIGQAAAAAAAELVPLLATTTETERRGDIRAAVAVEVIDRAA